MGCRILVTDASNPIHLQVTAPLDDADVVTVETAARVALEDGHRVVVDIATPMSTQLLHCLARLAATPDGDGRLTYRGADDGTARYLRGRGLGDRVAIETSP